MKGLNKRAKAEEEFNNLVGVVSSAVHEAKQYHQNIGIKVSPQLLVYCVWIIIDISSLRVLFVYSNYSPTSEILTSQHHMHTYAIYTGGIIVLCSKITLQWE